MNETQRLAKIDRLADRKLKQPGESRPATEVWDEAADEVDAAARQASTLDRDRAEIDGMTDAELVAAWNILSWPGMCVTTDEQRARDARNLDMIQARLAAIGINVSTGQRIEKAA